MADKIAALPLPSLFNKALDSRILDMGKSDEAQSQFAQMVSESSPARKKEKSGLSGSLHDYEEEAMKATLGSGDLNTLVQAATNAESTLRTVRTILSEAIKMVKEVHQMPV